MGKVKIDLNNKTILVTGSVIGCICMGFQTCNMGQLLYIVFWSIFPAIFQLYIDFWFGLKALFCLPDLG